MRDASLHEFGKIYSYINLGVTSSLIHKKRLTPMKNADWLLVISVMVSSMTHSMLALFWVCVFSGNAFFVVQYSVGIPIVAISVEIQVLS